MRSANTRRAYSIAVVKTADQLDGRTLDGLPAPSRPLVGVRCRDRLRTGTPWDQAAVNTWNARRAAVGKWDRAVRLTVP